MPSFLRLGRNLIQFVGDDNRATGLAEQILSGDASLAGGITVFGALGEKAVIRLNMPYYISWTIGVDKPGAAHEPREVWFMARRENARELTEAAEFLYYHETERTLRNRVCLTEEMIQLPDFSLMKGDDLALLCVPQFRELAQARSLQSTDEFTRAVVACAEHLFACANKLKQP
jgi:hypothetical protein